MPRVALDLAYSLRYPNNSMFSEEDNSEFTKFVVPKLPFLRTQYPGRLSSSLEGDGKRRVFAISNYVCQRLLLPVHNWAMAVLRSIPMDGTHDQLRPFFKLRDRDQYYCFDLKAATDRVPLPLIFEVFAHCFDEYLASSCIDTTLSAHVFLPLRDKCRNGKLPSLDTWSSKELVTFETGQPLVLLSSWALFALSHHVVVWAAAEFVYPGLIIVFSEMIS